MSGIVVPSHLSFRPRHFPVNTLFWGEAIRIRFSITRRSPSNFSSAPIRPVEHSRPKLLKKSSADAPGVARVSGDGGAPEVSQKQSEPPVSASKILPWSV